MTYAHTPILTDPWHEPEVEEVYRKLMDYFAQHKMAVPGLGELKVECVQIYGDDKYLIAVELDPEVDPRSLALARAWAASG